ncbi:MAG: helix-turn-helix domain-containing protein [Anaerotruncus rubiinfantis]|jgi:transcriptional regulator with XRE-family HTH domain
MTTEQMIKMALTYKSMSQSDLARQLGTTPQNLNQKIKRNTLTREDLEKIAVLLDAEFICCFRFPDGTEI